MDLQELCKGSYEDALTKIEKISAEKTAGPLEELLRGQSAKAGPGIANWWKGLPDPARLGIAGAGAGAGLGALGSLALGPKKNKRPLFGAALGGLMGGAALGGYGLLKDWAARPQQSPAEKVKSLVGQQATSRQRVTNLEDLMSGNMERMIRGGGGMMGFSTPKIDLGSAPPDPNAPPPDPNAPPAPEPPKAWATRQLPESLHAGNPHLDTALVTGGADLAGTTLRRRIPSLENLRTGLQTGNLKVPLPGGVSAGDLLDSANKRPMSTRLGMLKGLGSGIDVQTGTNLPAGAPEGTPAVPKTVRVPGLTLRDIARGGQTPGLFRGGFAGTALPRIPTHLGAQVATTFTHTLPNALEKAKLEAMNVDRQVNEATGALPARQFQAVTGMPKPGQ